MSDKVSVCELECMIRAHAHLARFLSEYSPSAVHAVHSVTVPPIDAVPARQSPHRVSAVGVQALIVYLPVAQVAQVEQPAAPALLYLPAGQTVQLVLPPVEYFPAGQATIPERSVSEMGLKPAGAVEHAACPFSAENSPSPEQAEQEVAANSAYSPFSHSTQASLTVMVPGRQGAHPVAATLLSVPAGHSSHSFFPPMLYFPISHSLQLWEARSAKKPGPQYVQVSLPALETKPSVCSQVVHDVLPGLLNFPSSQESQRVPASSTTSFSPPAHLSQPKEPSTRL